MNSPLSDCCDAPADGPLDPSKTLPGKSYGCCSKCLLPAVFNTPHFPEPRSAAGLLIGIGLTCALGGGWALMQGWTVAGCGGLLAAGVLGILAYRQMP